jgi:hypothetical protein
MESLLSFAQSMSAPERFDLIVSVRKPVSLLVLGLVGRGIPQEQKGAKEICRGKASCPFISCGLLFSRRQSHLPSRLVSSTRGPEIVKFFPWVSRGNSAGLADGGSSTNPDTPPPEEDSPAGPCGGR